MSIVTWKRALIAGAAILFIGGARVADKHYRPYFVPEDFVTVTVAYDPVYCRHNTTGHNIRIETINNSPKQIDAIDVWLSAKEPGHSHNILAGEPPLNHDWIIKPKETNVICWYIPGVGKDSPAAAERVYTIEKTNITFQPGSRDKK